MLKLMIEKACAPWAGRIAGALLVRGTFLESGHILKGATSTLPSF